MTARRILVATDFSRCSKAALQYATTIAQASNAQLVIVHVEPPGGAMDRDGPHFLMIDHGELANMLLSTIPRDSQLQFEHQMLHGDPACEILRAAAVLAADLIVMGKRGRTGPSRFVLGTVAHEVIRRAHCPVLLVCMNTGEPVGCGLDPRSRTIERLP